MADKEADQYPPEEAQRRFEAAIRGAGLVGHLEMKDIPRKPRAKPVRKRAVAQQRSKVAKRKTAKRG